MAWPHFEHFIIHFWYNNYPILIYIFSGDPKAILRIHSDKLPQIIATTLYEITDALYAKELIPSQAKQSMHVEAVDPYTKASNLMLVIETELDVSSNPTQYFIDVCHILINQGHQALTDIAQCMLKEIGNLHALYQYLILVQ